MIFFDCIRYLTNLIALIDNILGDKSRKKKLCKCIYKYEAQREDELEMFEGDVITVLDENAMEGWWRGSLHGKEGLFPNNFVELMDESVNENNVRYWIF